MRRYRLPVLRTMLLTLSLGTAVTMWSLHQAASAEGAPFPNSRQLVTAIAGSKSWSPRMFEAVAARTTLFDGMAGIQEGNAMLRAGGTTDIVRLESVSASYFDMLGVRPAMGRTFTADEDRRNGSAAVVMVSDALWQRLFGSATPFEERVIDVEAHRLQIIGVLPPAFHGLVGRTDLWAPLGSARWLHGDTGPERPSSRWFEVVGRLEPGLSIEAAQPRFVVEASQALSELGDLEGFIGPRARLGLVGLQDARVSPEARRAVTILTGAVVVLCGFVFVNLIGLAILQARQRRRDTAVRLALGARQVDLLLLHGRETLATTAAGLAGALLLRPVLLQALAAIPPTASRFGLVTSQWVPHTGLWPGWDAMGLLAAGAIAGSLPYLMTATGGRRSSWIEPALRSREPAGGAHRRGPAAALLTVQIALACLVLAGALLLIKATSTVFSHDRGYAMENVWTAQISLPSTTADPGDIARTYEALTTRLRATPGIESAGVVNCAPGGGECYRSNISHVDGVALAGDEAPTVGVHFSSPEYLDTIGAQVMRGRAFTSADAAGAGQVAIVSAPLAARLWPEIDPIGRTLALGSSDEALAAPRTVVGVLRPVWYRVDGPGDGDVYVPAAQVAWAPATVAVRSAASLAQVSDALARGASAVDPRIAVHQIGPLASRLARSLSTERLLARALGGFSLIALALAALGTFTLVSQIVESGRHELAVRVALGASRGRIWHGASHTALVATAIGVGAGTATVVFTSHVLAAFLHGVSPLNGAALAGAAAITGATTLAALAWPAYRATRVDAARALRS